jgi:ABC-type antimicrobial peptide transport system permease subunit
MATGVAERTDEIALRMALGAERHHVLRLVMRRGLTLAAIGIAIGTIGALALSRLLATMLYGVGEKDAATFAGVALLLGVVSAIAGYVPARRAMRVDPLVALRRQ